MHDVSKHEVRNHKGDEGPCKQIAQHINLSHKAGILFYMFHRIDGLIIIINLAATRIVASLIQPMISNSCVQRMNSWIGRFGDTSKYLEVMSCPRDHCGMVCVFGSAIDQRQIVVGGGR